MSSLPSVKPGHVDHLDAERVTAVITSHRRQDLLEKTIDSFLAHNTYRNLDAIVVEDGSGKRNRRLVEKYRDRSIRWMETGRWLGQIAAIDQAYAAVNAPYIFHMEDDWEFTEGGFIEKSLAILRERRDCLLVLIRAPDDLNGHPLEQATDYAGRIPFRRLRPDYRVDMGPGESPLIFHGFSFNPGLRRLSDYRDVGSYARHAKTAPGAATRSEAAIGALYHNRGLYCAVLADNEGRGYVRHIGEGRHVHDPITTRAARKLLRLGRKAAHPLRHRRTLPRY